MWSEPIDCSNRGRLGRLATATALCLLLSGCPFASNPSQESSSSSSSGAGSASSSSSSPVPSGGYNPIPGGSPAGSPTGSPDGSIDGSPDGSATGQSGGRPGGSAQGRDGDLADKGAPEPGFEPDSDGGADLPDLRDTPASQGTGGAGSETASAQTGSGPGDGDARGEGAGSDTAANGSASGKTPGSTHGGGPGAPGGPLTPAEQVAVLDAELERGTGEFDDLIRDEQAEQQRRARDNAAAGSASSGAGETASGGADGTGFPEPVGRAGVYEGGMAGGAPGGAPPENPVKFPPPADIPSGDDDDVVARQLREAAMREPDPAVREKLWEEYRKYKGIDQ